MRGTVSKRLRKYTTTRFPHLTTTPLYRLDRYGSSTKVLAEQSQRRVYQKLKKAFKKARRLGLILNTKGI
jgi:hypothetical protein